MKAILWVHIKGHAWNGRNPGLETHTQDSLFPAQELILCRETRTSEVVLDLWLLWYIYYPFVLPFLQGVQGKAFRKKHTLSRHTFDWKTVSFQILSTALSSDTFQINECSRKTTQATWCWSLFTQKWGPGSCFALPWNESASWSSSEMGSSDPAASPRQL